MVSLELRHVSKRFPGQTAVDDLSMTIPNGELFCLLGPSGCGKTTTLQLIAGLLHPDDGQILADGVDVTGTPVQRRNIGVVFQNFALFPHMTVAQNVAYGLRAQRRGSSEVRERTEEMLAFVGLTDKADRHPRSLSGGEQQRVALARAIAIDPTLLLLDEPFSSLDRELRLELRTELARIQRETKLTTIFVTHDQDEAFAIADSVAVCDRGRVQQVATPRELYETPSNSFVARFVGRSNVLTGALSTVDGVDLITVDGVSLPVGAVPHDGRREATLLIRPESIFASSSPPRDATTIDGVVETVEYAGSSTLYHVSALGTTLLASRSSDRKQEPMSPGEHTHLWWDTADTYVIPNP